MPGNQLDGEPLRWPGGNSKRGFSKEQGSRQAHFPTHLLAGSMACGCCGATIAQVSGKSGGYYGCLAATKGACENKTLVRRTLAEKVVLGAVQDQISDPEHIAYVLQRVEQEIAKQRADLPDTLKLKEAELTAEQRRLANFVDFIGEGRGSQALAKALVETERRVETLNEEVDSLQRSRDKIFRPPPVEWIRERLKDVQSVLEQRTARSAQMLRSLLGPIRLELQTPDIGRPFYRAVTTLDALALIETPSDQSGAEGGSNTLQRWRRRERKPRNSQTTSGNPISAGCRVVAESFGGHRGVVAVSGKGDVEPVPRPVLIWVPVEDHHAPATVGTVAAVHLADGYPRLPDASLP